MKRLRVAHARKLKDLRRVNVVDMVASIPNGVSHQQASIFFVEITNRDLHWFARRLCGLEPYYLSGQEDFGWGWLRRLGDTGWLGLSERNLIHRKVHASDVTSRFQFIVQSFGCSPDEQIGRGISLGGLHKYFVFPPLDLEGLTPSGDLIDRFAKLNHRQVIQCSIQVNDLGAIARGPLDPLAGQRYPYSRNDRNNKDESPHRISPVDLRSL